MASKYYKTGAKVFEYLIPKPKVNTTKLDKAKSKLNKAIQATKGSKAKLNQTLFEIENKQPLTFKSQKGIKTKSNTELKKEKKAEKEKKFKKTMDDNKKAITKIFNAPKNFNKGGRAGKMGGGMMGSKSLQKTEKILRKNKKDGGRMGLKKGGGSDLGMQSVKYGLDNNPDVTKADPKAKFIAAAKNKKSKKKVI